MTSGAIEQKFTPAWWLPGGHSQTLWRKFSPVTPVKQVRERIELADGDFIDLDWCAETSHKEQAGERVVFIVHGLCGCSQSSYVMSLQALLARHHIASVAMNLRGCSGEVNRLARAYHSGVSEDLDETFSRVLERYPDKEFYLVGYSLGANVLLKWLGEAGHNPRIRGAVAVSTPFALDYCSQAMLQGMSRWYGKYFVTRLVADFRRKISHFRETGEGEQLQRLQALGDLEGISSIWDFDEVVTAPLHGFADASDYYKRSSSIGFLSAIGTDTLLIQSRNDPLIPEQSLPDTGTLPGCVELRLCDHGGHVGFFSGLQDHWLEHQILDFVNR